MRHAAPAVHNPVNKSSPGYRLTAMNLQTVAAPPREGSRLGGTVYPLPTAVAHWADSPGRPCAKIGLGNPGPEHLHLANGSRAGGRRRW